MSDESDMSSLLASGSGQSGLTDYCRQMQNGGLAGGSANKRAADMCLSKYMRCADSCDSLANTYSSQPDVASAMRSRSASCRALSSKVSQLTSQSSSSLSAANSGVNCSQLGQAMPSSLPGGNDPQSGMGANAGDPYGCASNPNSPACVQCSSNPSNPACQALTKAAQEARGEAGFKTPDLASAKSTFNLPDNADATMDGPVFGSDKNGAEAPKVNGVPNNSGGGIPGAGGGGSQQAKLDSGKRGLAPQSAGYNLGDLDQGMRSGGYSQPAGGAESYEAPSGGFGGGRGLASVPRLDLKQYLPGGVYDPTRARFGGLRPPGTQIHGKHIDIWNRITERMNEKCRIGELYGCG